jgi:Family of unknown function (DUF6225)
VAEVIEDEELFDHQVTAWMVGQLRQAMEGLPDDLPVSVLVSQEPGGEFADEQVVISAAPWASVDNASAEHVRRKLASGELQPDHFEISLEFPRASTTGGHGDRDRFR